MWIAQLEYGTMAMGLLGGLSIFLFGMEQMTTALKSLAGERMKSLLARLTTNRFKAVLAGGGVTAVIQSSSVTTVLAVGFVSAGLMTLEQSVGIIMGASIGTTITAQIIAFNVTKYALAIVTIGFVLQFFFQSDRIRQRGMILFGLGLIFFGMTIMKEAMSGLRTHEPFLEMMQRMDGAVLGILMGAAFTALVQSSSATTAILIVLGAEGLLSLEGAIAIVLGANIGTCVTAMLAAIGKSRAALQTAMVHVTFNVFGVILWIGFIPLLADWMQDISSDLPRQIANAHTTFNVANTFIFIGFTPLFARLVRWLVPDKPEVDLRKKPKYLDENLLEVPALALDSVRLELVRMGGVALRIIERAPAIVVGGTLQELHALKAADDDVDSLHGAIVNYLGRLSQQQLAQPETERLYEHMAIANYIENMSDVVEKNLVQLGRERLGSDVVVSPETREVVDRLSQQVLDAARSAIDAVRDDDQALAKSVIKAKRSISRLANAAQMHLTKRLVADVPHRRQAYAIEQELVETLKRIYYNAKRVARIVAHVDKGYLQESGES